MSAFVWERDRYNNDYWTRIPIITLSLLLLLRSEPILTGVETLKPHGSSRLKSGLNVEVLKTGGPNAPFSKRLSPMHD